MTQKTLIRLLAGTCVVLLALDLGLALRVRELVSRVEVLDRVVAARDRQTLVEGAPFPRITLLGPDDTSVPLLLEEEYTGTLLLISSRACDACEAVRAHWEQAATTARGSHLRVLELVLDAEPEELSQGAAPWPQVRPSDDKWSLVSKIPGIPGAVFVEEPGRVWRAFYGANHEGLPAAVEEFLLR